MASIKLSNTVHAVVENVFEHEEEYMVLLKNMRQARREFGVVSSEFKKAYDLIHSKGEIDLTAKGYEWTEEFDDIVFAILSVIELEEIEKEEA